MDIIKLNFKWRKPLISLDLNKVLFIVVHHPEAITATPEQIHEWHLECGWDGFGYNEYIRKDGTVYIGRGDNIGAQCANMNSKSYGICCEGNYDIEASMPDVQYNALVERIRYNKARFPNLIDVAPHSKYNPTACPGKYFPMNNLLQDISKANKPSIKVNGTSLNADVVIINNSMYAPVRPLVQALGKQIVWDDKNKIAEVI